MHAFQPSSFPVFFPASDCYGGTAAAANTNTGIVWLISHSPPNRRALFALLSISVFLALLKMDLHLVGLSTYIQPDALKNEYRFFSIIVMLELYGMAICMLVDTLLPRCSILRVTVAGVAALAFTLLHDRENFADLDRRLIVTCVCRLFLPRPENTVRLLSYSYTQHAAAVVGLTQLLPHTLACLVHTQLPASFPFDYSRELFIGCLVPVLLTLFWSHRALLLVSEDDLRAAENAVVSGDLDDRSRKIVDVARQVELLRLMVVEQEQQQQQQEQHQHTTTVLMHQLDDSPFAVSKPHNGFTFALKLLNAAVLFDRPLVMTLIAAHSPLDPRRDLVVVWIGWCIVSFSASLFYQNVHKEYLQPRLMRLPITTYPLLDNCSKVSPIYTFRLICLTLGVAGLCVGKLLYLWTRLATPDIANPAMIDLIVLIACLLGFGELARLALIDLSNDDHLTNRGRNIARWQMMRREAESGIVDDHHDDDHSRNNRLINSHSDTRSLPKNCLADLGARLCMFLSLKLIRSCHPIVLGIIIFSSWLAVAQQSVWQISAFTLILSGLFVPLVAVLKLLRDLQYVR